MPRKDPTQDASGRFCRKDPSVVSRRFDWPPRRDELPESLFRVVSIPLLMARPDLAEALAATPETVLPLPEGLDDRKRKQLANLAQYRGRTPEGRLRAMSNLPQKRNPPSAPDTPDADDLAGPPVGAEERAGLPAPTVPAAIPATDAQGLVRKTANRKCMSQEEWDLYEETWYRWMRIHHEHYNAAEDYDDLEMICIEAVMMARIRQLMMQYPHRDYENPYNNAYKRQQTARRNLAASRRDREAEKKEAAARGGSGVHVNIALGGDGISSSNTDEFLEMSRQFREKELEFMQKTKDRGMVTPENFVSETVDAD